MIFFKGKVARIEEEAATKTSSSGSKTPLRAALNQISVDLAVLATGMQPNTSLSPVPAFAQRDDYGFIASMEAAPGFYRRRLYEDPGGRFGISSGRHGSSS